MHQEIPNYNATASDRPEQVLKRGPSAQAGYPRFVGLLQQLPFAQQVTGLSEGDEQNPVKQPLGRLNRGIEVGVSPAEDLPDERKPALSVEVIEFLSHGFLPASRLLQDRRCVQ